MYYYYLQLDLKHNLSYSLYKQLRFGLPYHKGLIVILLKTDMDCQTSCIIHSYSGEKTYKFV